MFGRLVLLMMTLAFISACRPSAPPATVRPHQGGEYGTYISTITNPAISDSQIYLKNAEAYYKDWGYPHVREASTIADILTDLARSTRHIDAFRIVLHSSSQSLDIGLTKDIAPEGVAIEDLMLNSAESFRRKVGSMSWLDPYNVTAWLQALRQDSITGPLLGKIGLGPTDPPAEEPLGSLLLAILDSAFPYMASLPNGSGVPAIRNSAVLADFNNRRIAAYRRLVELAAPAAQVSSVRQAITDLIKATPAVLQRSTVGVNLDQATADTLVDEIIEPGTSPPVLRRDLLAAILEGTGGGPFLSALNKVRSKIDATTHIELRGCNAGRNALLLDAVRSLFGSPNNLPSISAPDLYQIYHGLGYEMYPLVDPVGQQDLAKDWSDPFSRLADGYDDAFRIRNREMIRVVLDTTFAALGARYELGLSVQDLQLLNVEVDPNDLTPGQVIWLVGRMLPAGSNTTIENFCANVLGSRALAPQIAGFNPQLAQQSTLKSTDDVWLVPESLRSRLASPRRTLSDLTAVLQQGKGYGGWDLIGRGFRVSLDESKRQQAMGFWAAEQHYDFRARDANALSRLFAGSKTQFQQAVEAKMGQVLSREYPVRLDPIFPDDPRYEGHIIRRP